MQRKAMFLLILLFASCSSSSQSIETLQQRGVEYANSERFKEAIEVFSFILTIDPANAVALSARGAIYGELGMYDEALADLGAAIPNPKALQNRANVYWKMRRYEESIADSKQLLSTEAESAATYGIMASCYSALADFEQAATNYKRVCELEPENHMAFINYGGMLIELEQYEQAEKLFTQAIVLKQDDYSGWALRCKTRRLVGNLEGAEEDSRMAKKLNPDWGQ